MTKITRIFDLLDQYGDQYNSVKDALGYKRNNVWNTYSAKDYVSFSNRFSKGLLQLGVKKGDAIATILVNCPEWNFIDMGLAQIGAVHIPVYPNISEFNYLHIFKDAEVKYIFVSDKEMYQRIKPVFPNVPSLLDVYSIKKDIRVKHWTEILDLGDVDLTKELSSIKKEINTHDLLTIIYTSGTTGIPKGVMLTHANFISNYQACAKIPKLNKGDRALSFLPLCHVYERMLSYLYQSFGLSIYYEDNFENIGRTLNEIKPHIFSAVPRVLEKVYDRIYRKGRNLKIPSRILFFWAIKLGEKFDLPNHGKYFYQLKLSIANFLVFKKWRMALGNNVKMIISGGAPLQPRLARIFWAAGIPVMEGYGLTETSPVVSVQTFKPDGFKFETVGPVLEGVQVKIASDGEILCKGPCLMKGYHNLPELTKEVIDVDGWFHTGDIGMLVDNKFLKITDRKKEIFKTSTGKYVAPQVIENLFKQSPFIESIMVIGESRHFVSALIIPSFEYLKSWCNAKEMEYSTNESAANNPVIIERIGREIEQLNKQLNQTEKVKKFRLVSDDWTAESSELSPTLKLKRKYILRKYKDVVEEIYQ